MTPTMTPREPSATPARADAASGHLRTLDCRRSPDAALAREVQDVLDRELVVTIRNFPTDAETLVQFSRYFGEPMARRGTAAAAASLYTGDVRLRTDIAEGNRLPTQTATELSLHTARSFEVRRPRFFAMLMVEPGWIGEAPGHNGESLLARFRDVVAEYRAKHPATADRDLDVLQRTRIAYRPWYLNDEPTHEPLMRFGADGDVEVRYWEDLLSTLAEALQTFANPEDAAAFADVVRRFDVVLNTARSRVEYQMHSGQLTLLDNRRVAHARRPFVPTKPGSDGRDEVNPRRMLTVHIL